MLHEPSSIERVTRQLSEAEIQKVKNLKILLELGETVVPTTTTPSLRTLVEAFTEIRHLSSFKDVFSHQNLMTARKFFKDFKESSKLSPQQTFTRARIEAALVSQEREITYDDVIQILNEIPSSISMSHKGIPIRWLLAEAYFNKGDLDTSLILINSISVEAPLTSASWLRVKGTGLYFKSLRETLSSIETINLNRSFERSGFPPSNWSALKFEES